MKKIVASNPVTAFVVITFFFSWTLWLLMILSNNNLLPFKFPTTFWGSFGPLVGSILITSIIYGKDGLKKILLSLVSIKSDLPNYIFALFLIAGIYAFTILIIHFIEPAAAATGKLPGAGDLIKYFFIILAIGGPLGEEIGWRGFLQLELHKRFTPLTASAVIGIIWFTWHIPLFWLEGAAQEGSSLISFFVSVVSMTFLFTWLFLRTGGSLFFAILFHTSINYVSALIIPFLFPASGESRMFNMIFIIILAAAAIIFTSVSRKNFLYKHDKEKIHFRN